MAYREKDAIVPASELPTLGHVDVLNEGEYVDEKVGSLSSRDSLDDATDRDEVVLVKGEPVITTGRDVSRFLLDTRDDGDPALTFRSAVLGTVFAGLGAALCQVGLRIPIQSRRYSFLLDIPLQTDSSGGLHRLPSAPDLFRGYRMGCYPSPCYMG